MRGYLPIQLAGKTGTDSSATGFLAASPPFEIERRTDDAARESRGSSVEKEQQIGLGTYMETVAFLRWRILGCLGTEIISFKYMLWTYLIASAAEDK